MKDFLNSILVTMYRLRKIIAFLGWCWIILAALWFFLLVSPNPELQAYAMVIFIEIGFCGTWGWLHLWFVKHLEKRYAGA